ncbi:MAG: YkgJ family cysteine cluster protein [Tepidisphaeraceae bacterium]|jgi:hypothetical protein
MKLKVLESGEPTAPWFAEGLRFTCMQCGNCCSGNPGYVWIGRREIAKLVEILGISRKELIETYCRKMGRRIALKEIRNPRHGGHDCVFMKEVPASPGDGKALPPDGKVVHPKRICTVYEARPLQCRTWPFWEGNLMSPKAWARASRTCMGMDRGEFFDRERIEKLRDAKEWPERAPTS